MQEYQHQQNQQETSRLVAINQSINPLIKMTFKVILRRLHTHTQAHTKLYTYKQQQATKHFFKCILSIIIIIFLFLCFTTFVYAI